MQLIRHLTPSQPPPCAIAIGNFDGLHLGHRAILEAMRKAAGAQYVPSVLTFEPHPRRYFQPHAKPFRLMRLRDKLMGLRAAGIEQLIMPKFDKTLANMPAGVFLEKVLGHQLCARAVITGENFVFGQGRQGDVSMLQAWGAAQGVVTITVPVVRSGNEVCSSSAVRAAIASGDMPSAARMLGREYSLAGRVVHGEGRGRTIGFPTANIALPPGLQLPRLGVYAVRVAVEGHGQYHGVANIGMRPTVAAAAVVERLEVHLFASNRSWYGARFRVTFFEHLRDEKKFESMEALTRQIAIDCARAQERLGIAHG